MANPSKLAVAQKHPKSTEEVWQERVSALTKRVLEQGDKYGDLGKRWPNGRKPIKPTKRRPSHAS